VVITPESAALLPGIAASGDTAAAASMRRIAQACEQSIGLHHQLVLANGLMDEVRESVGPAPHRRFVRQESQYGDLESLVLALRSLDRAGARELYFLTADAPVTPQSIRLLRTKLRASGAAMVALTGPISDAVGDVARVVQAQRDTPGAEVLAVVHQSKVDALRDDQTMSFRAFDGDQRRYTREELLGIRSVSIGAFAWQSGALRKCVDQVPYRPDGAHYWVSDLVEVLRTRRFMVRAFPIGHMDEVTQIDAEQALEKAGRACFELVDAARTLTRSRGSRATTSVE
jgi:bifunctional N-acetylglucosamine-1-phosphate-uridyltransferase/glucosamine-1-phosphate-acetyltransferase GlmU-like protein